MTWESTELLEQNRQRLLKEIGRRLREYEARYELSSRQVEAELAAGRLRDTHEIAQWVIDIRTYRALSRERRP